MASWPIHQITAFAGSPFEGNPAFVLVADRVLAPDLLDDIRTQLKEDVLTVLRPDGAVVHVDFTTAQGSHAGPGHSTHAAAWVAMNRLGRDADSVGLMLRDGETRLSRKEGDLIAVDWPIMAASRTEESRLLSPALSATPLETYQSAFGTVAVMADERTVRDMAPDLDAMMALSADTLIVTARSDAADFVIRVFAPKLGLPEDPVCGTAHRILAPYWSERSGRRQLVSHQLSGRGGELFCRLDGDTVTIAGRATPFLDGMIKVPD